MRKTGATSIVRAGKKGAALGIWIAALLGGQAMREAHAQSSEEMQRCAVITATPDKLACFENLSAQYKSVAAERASNAAASAAQNNWVIETSKSAVDDSPEVYAINFAEEEGELSAPVGLNLRCREHKSEFIVFTNGFWGMSPTRLSVLYRIDNAEAKTMVWRSSTDGKGAFFPKEVASFIRSLPPSGKLFVRVADFSGNTHDATFQLAGLESARAQVGAACKWPNK